MSEQLNQSMKYVVKKNTLSNDTEIEISEEEFNALLVSTKTLSNILAIEEKYQIVLENYFEFEKTLFEEMLQNKIFNIDYAELHQTQMKLNQRIMNLFTSIISYRDSIDQHLHLIDKSFSVKKHKSHEYDSNIEYEIMEALRNYVQHNGLPTHYLEINQRWRDYDSVSLNEMTLGLFITKSRLTNSDFKRTTLHKMADKTDLKNCIRTYVDCFGNIHKEVRNMLENAVNNARVTIEILFTKYLEYSGDSQIIGVQAYKINNQQIIHEIPILLKWDDIRIQLQIKNKVPTYFKTSCLNSR